MPTITNSPFMWADEPLDNPPETTHLTQTQLINAYQTVYNAGFAVSNIQQYTTTNIIPTSQSTQSSGWYVPAELTYRGATVDNTISPRFPIGTIVKWDISQQGVREYLKNRGIKSILLKIVSYFRDGKIKEGHYSNEIFYQEIINSSSLFIEANEKEKCHYEEEQRKLQDSRLKTRPTIGTVLEYIGMNSDLKLQTGIVIAEASHNRIVIRWADISRSDEYVEFNKFKIADSQRKGFKIDADQYCNCDHCTSLRPYTNVVLVNSAATLRTLSFCDRQCAQEQGYRQCTCCSTYTKERADEITSDFVCISCFENYFSECQVCNRFHHNSNLENSTCRYCRENVRRLIHEHSFRPNFLFNKMAWENTRYLGIELEIECRGNGYDRETLADRIKTWLSQQPKSADVTLKTGKVIAGKEMDKLVYLKSDGSLTNGIEIVWHPFTLKSFHKNFPLQAFLKFLNENKGYIKDTCGMHIHVSKDKLSTMDLMKGKWFFYRCKQYLMKFSERTNFNYSRFDDYPTVDPYSQEYGHYSVLNIASPSAKTLEVRVFKATLDHTKFLANIQFSDVFVDYIQNGCGLAFLKTASAPVIWQQFIDYAKSQNRYQVFTSWILTRGIV